MVDDIDSALGRFEQIVTSTCRPPRPDTVVRWPRTRNHPAGA